MGNSNQSEQRWILVLAMGLLLSSLTLSWVTRSGNCFDSHWVSGIEVTFENKTITIPSCRVQRSVPFDQWIHDNLSTLSARVKAVERILSELDIPPRSLGGIKLSEAELFETPNMERQFLNRALWADVKDLEPQLVSDLLIEGWVKGRAIPTDGLSLDHQMWHSLISLSFMDLNLSERHRFVREWIQKLKTSRSVVTERKTDWDFAQRIQKKAQVLGFDPGQSLWNLPSLVVFEREPDKLTERRLRENRISNLKQHQLQMPFSSDRFSLSEAGTVRVGKLILVRCHLPDLTELEFIGFEFEHVVVIRTCEDHIPDFYITAVRNTKDFALKYPDSQFIHIHWPSLRMVLARSGVKARTIASLFEPGSIQTFTKVGFLKNLKKDEESGLSHWDGALAPLLYFRL